jgi:hypothetical protein
MQPLNAVPRHTAISTSAKIRFMLSSLVGSESNIFGAQITGVFVCNEMCDLKHLPCARTSRLTKNIRVQNSQLIGQHRGHP